MSTTSKGEEFVNQVAELYQLMGHKVNKNVGVLGHQIDIVLSYMVPGGIESKTAVECKYVGKGNLRLNDVKDNIYALVDLKRNDEVQHLVIVTTNGFAKDIWDTAKANKIELLTFRELQHQIVNFDQYLDFLIRNFETDELSKYYIDLIAQDDEKMPLEIFDPMDTYVAAWTNDSKKNHLSILGEYGTGKTTFCRKFAHDLAVQYNEDPLNNRIPILINLRDYSKVMSVRQLITDLLINEYGLLGINFPLFEKMNKEGLFLLIFDGFDEMAQKVVFDVAYSNFSKIAELAEPSKSKVILTCRTEFFRTHEQEKEILLDIDKHENFGIIYLKEFNDEQIKEFLQKRVPLLEREKKKKQGWEYYYQKIQDIFDLKDLAKRPVLLELVVKYLPHLAKKGEKINASTLYDTTIHEELKRKLKVGRTFIERNDRIKLMKLLAVWMYNNDKLSVYYGDIPDLLNLKAHFDLKTRMDIEYHLTDFLTCSFLNRDTEGNYRFSHKSFVDFLVASKFVEDIRDNFKDDFIQKMITYEVIQFMKNLEIDRSKLYTWIESTKRRSFSETKYLGGNAVSVLNELGENFAERRFDFSETVLDYVNFHGQDLRGVNFNSASLRYANLSKTNLADSNFSNADLEGANFGEMNEIWRICWSPDEKYLVSGDEDGIIKIWDRIDFEEVATLKVHTMRSLDFQFSFNGKFLAIKGDMEVKFWDMNTFKEVAALEMDYFHTTDIIFSPDGKYLVSRDDKEVKLRDMNTFEEVATLEICSKNVAFSLDGKYLVTRGVDGVVFWDMNTFEEVATLEMSILCSEVKMLSPDEKYLVSRDDKEVRLWDISHIKRIEDLALSPDKKYLVIEDNEGLKLRDMNTFKEVSSNWHTERITDLALSPDRKYLASSSLDKTIKIWSIDPKKGISSECQHTIVQQINCKNMKIRGARGLEKEKISFLEARGAII